VKESLRWRPNLQEVGFPHRLSEDLEFEGWKFEKGTIFTPNAWYIHLNPQEHYEPLNFRPERYLDEYVNDPLQGHWAFGAGTSFPVSFALVLLWGVLTARSTSLRWISCCCSEYVYGFRSPSVLL
jgi:cytochrome P450